MPNALSQDRLLTLIGMAYDAALDGRNWSRFLGEFARSFHGGGVLFSQDMRSAEAGIVEFSGFDPLWVNRYVQHYSATNLWLASAAKDPEGTLVIGEQRVDKRTLAASEFYNDWLRPQSLFTTAGTILLKRGDVLTSLAVIRSRRPGSFDQEELAVWSKLMPHVQRAVQVHRELFSVRSHRDGALEALQGLRTAVLLAADDSRLLFCNDIAEQILSAGSGLSVRNGRLVAASPAATASLQAAIKNAATMDAGIADGSGGLVALPNGEHERLVVLVCPFKPGHELLPFCSPTALVLISARRCQPRILASDLMRLYGLTMAEARLACGLVQGFDPDEYSRQAGTSVATARTQLKQVFLKTGIHSQPALMRLILTNRLLRIHSAQD